METRRFSWVVLFIAINGIVGLKGDELGNATVHSQSNTTTSLAPSKPLQNKTYSTEVVINNKNRYKSPYNRGGGGGGGSGGGGGGGGGGYGWGWGGGGGGGGGGRGGGGRGGGGGGGWGWGGGGGGFYKWGCGGQPKHGKGKGRGGPGVGGMSKNHASRKRGLNKEDYKVGEFAQCMARGSRCRGMRLDCPLHCGGPCSYDCQHMCKAHCRRS